MSGRRWPALLFTVLVLLALSVATGVASTPERMLAEQLQARGIRDPRVLDAFRRVHRDAFVPAAARARAYDDTPLAIGHGQTISQPYIVALMTELLDLEGDERVLEIGTGSGYQAAILAELVRTVYTVEIIPDLAASARLRLTRQGYRNVHVKVGDGALGWREYAPYDAIMVTAVAPRVPLALIEQLADEGVLVMPLGEPGGRQVLVRGVKRGGKLRTREITEVRFVPMTGEGVRRGPPTEGDEERRRSPTRARPPAPEPRDPRIERPRPPGRVIEEELESRDRRERGIGTRPRRDARSRVAHAPRVRDGGRPSANAAADRAAGGSHAGARRSVG